MPVPRPRHPRWSDDRGPVSALSIAVLLMVAGAAVVALSWPEGRRREAREEAPGHTEVPRASAPLAPGRAGAPSPDSPGTAGPAAEPAVQPSTVPAPRGLFARTALSPEQERLLHDADESAVAACMRERGFAYVPNSFDDARADEAAGAEPGLEDLEAASAHGYGIAEALEAPEIPPPDANAEEVERLSPEAQNAWSDALSGPPIEPADLQDLADVRTVTAADGSTLHWRADSCLARARRVVYGDDLKQAELTVALDELGAQADDRAREDPEYRAGVERWRGCMGQRGFSYGDPGDAAEALAEDFHQGRLGLAELRQREIEVATADATCYGEAGLAPLFDAARARAEAAVERDHRGVLEDFIVFQSGALARAERLAHQTDPDAPDAARLRQ